MIKPVKWKTRLELISPEQVNAIHQASLRIMGRTGLVMPMSPARQDQARDLGLKIDTDTQRVYFPLHIVEAALKQAPHQYTLCARNPENDLVLDGNTGYLTLDGSGTDVLDLDTGAVRPSTKSDLEAAVRVADALPQIAFLWPAVSARDCAPAVQPLHELEAMLTCSSKHTQAMTAVDALNARGTIEMAAEVAGGREALRERPIISNFQCSVSPLSYDEKALEAAFIFGEAGIPTGFMNMTIGVGTAPATVAGNAVVANAEVLAGVVLFELFFPGVPTFYGSCATTMELRSGGVTAGGPEDFLLQATGCQMARFYGLPSNTPLKGVLGIGTFATGAKWYDWHAGVDNAISGAVSQFAGADMMCGAGLLNGARIFSFEQLLMDCEIYDILRAVAQGFEVNEETLALAAIEAAGPRSHFMTSPHTRAHMREVWQPSVMDRSPWDEWVRQGRPTADDRAQQAARRLLATHQPEPLPCAERLREIIAAYERQSAERR
jgi:trimethylamine--corrinoid protein Co-methyltransferase